MEAVNNSSKKDITIILIAHRLNTVKNCDDILNSKKVKLLIKDHLIKSSIAIKNLSSFS